MNRSRRLATALIVLASAVPTSCDDAPSPQGSWPVWAVCPDQQAARIESEVARTDKPASATLAGEDALRQLVDRAVMGEEPPARTREIAVDSPEWQLRLASTLDAGLRGDGPPDRMTATLEELESQLEEAKASLGPGSLRWEAAIAANLAAAMVRDADFRGLEGEDRIAALRSAIGVLEGRCQVPEVFLNEVAIRLELAELMLGADREGELDAARGRLSDLEQSDADGCSDSPGQFFGIDPAAPNFYIIDGSESIRAEPQLKRLFDEFTRTVSSLPEVERFAAFVFAREFVPVSIPGTREDRSGWSTRGTASAEQIEQAIRSVMDGMGSVKLNATRPKGPLDRAIEMGASAVFLVTDGAIGDGQAGDLAKVRRALAAAKVRVNTVLLFREDTTLDHAKNLAALERASGPLRQLAEATGGMFITRIISPKGSDFSRSGNTILASMRSKGRWTVANERQYRILKGDLAAFSGDHAAAAAEYRAAIAAISSGTDPVTEREPVPCGDWPSLGGGPATGLPCEPGLLFRWACAERLVDPGSDALERSARTLAETSRAGRLDTSRMGPAALQDLACRLLLFEALTSSPDERAEAVTRNRELAAEFGVLGSGWNARLLDGGGGGLAAWRTRLACRLFPDESGLAALEWDLVRSAFLAEQSPVPDLSGFPPLERALLAGVVATSPHSAPAAAAEAGADGEDAEAKPADAEPAGAQSP